MGRKKRLTAWSEEERKLRLRIVEMGYKHYEVAEKVGISPQDFSNVVSGKSRSPRYVYEVYRFLGLANELPDTLFNSS